ncbi:MAG: hypothetical protein H6688_01640 [Erysipelotrichaceae bacterium]|nr:hypothetical protein [Erysipelotrichaceae bacterium]
MEEKENMNAEEPRQAPASAEMNPNDKNALIAFILSIVGFCLSCGWIIGGIAGVVLGIVSLSFNTKSNGGHKKPFTIFTKIAKPVAIVSIVFGAIAIVGYTIALIAAIVSGISAATI